MAQSQEKDSKTSNKPISS